MKISFDFDNTLDQPPIQVLCKKFIALGAEVFVTTSRAIKMHSNTIINNDEVFEITDQLGIKRENVRFTSYDDKYKYIKDMDIHFDDDVEQIFLINQFPGKCLGFLFEDKPNNGIKDW